MFHKNRWPRSYRTAVQLLLCGGVGVGLLLHGGCTFLAVGVRGEHLLHGGGFGALRQLDQFVQRIGHAVGAETVFHGEFEAVRVSGILLFLRELCVGEGRYDLSQLRIAEFGQRAALGGSAALRAAEAR